MQPTCEEIVQGYLAFLQNGINTKRDNEECLIITPFLNPYGDHIELRVRYQNGVLFISDDGASFDHLFLSGIDLENRSFIRKYYIDTALNINGAFVMNGEIAISVKPEEDIGSAINRLIRAINAIQYLTYTIRGQATRTFKEEVASFMKEKGLKYTEDYIISGLSRDHRFDFYIPNKRLILIKALSTQNIGYARRLAMETAFAYIDVRQVNMNIFGISLLDDERTTWPDEILSILIHYSNKVIKWSHKEELLQVVA
jgi:hypothetical protein